MAIGQAAESIGERFADDALSLALVSSILEAMDGIAYITSVDGRIIALPSTKWNAFFGENSQEPIDASLSLGKNLFDCIGGEDVRALYRKIHQFVVNDRIPRQEYSYRCDAPKFERVMKMSISPIICNNRIAGILYQSTTMREISRPPIDIFLERGGDRTEAADEPVNLLAICSFCQKVHFAADGDTAHKEWVTPEEYYAGGGSSHVLLSHGVCPSCEYTLLSADSEARHSIGIT